MGKQNIAMLMFQTPNVRSMYTSTINDAHGPIIRLHIDKSFASALLIFSRTSYFGVKPLRKQLWHKSNGFFRI